jgi:hypothetical protein
MTKDENSRLNKLRLHLDRQSLSGSSRDRATRNQIQENLIKHM